MAEHSPSADPVERAGRDMPGGHGDPAVWGPRLGRLLDQQLALYRKLDDLGARQSSLVECGETDELLSLLSERKSVIGRITALNAEIEPFARGWATLLEALGRMEREAIAGRLAQIDELVARITERDDADRAALERRREVVSGELKTASRTRSAVHAYAKPADPAVPPRFQDREG